MATKIGSAEWTERQRDAAPSADDLVIVPCVVCGDTVYALAGEEESTVTCRFCVADRDALGYRVIRSDGALHGDWGGDRAGAEAQAARMRSQGRGDARVVAYQR